MQIHISPATRRSQHHYNPTHCTTTDFGQLGVARTFEVLPGDKINAQCSNFLRFATLAKPTFGKIRNNTLSVWVPYHILKYDADAFLSGRSQFNGEAVYSPVVSDYTLGTLMCYNFGSRFSPLARTSVAVDSVPWMTVETSKNYYLTPMGRFVYRLLQQLGYDIVNELTFISLYGASYNPPSIGLDFAGDQYSAFPLLAFFKAYNDLLSSQQTQNNSLFSRILRMWYQGSISDVTISGIGTIPVAYIDASNSSYVLSPYVLRYMFTQIRLLWDDDLITEAWRLPSAPVDFYNSNPRSVKLPITGSSTGDNVAVEHDYRNNYTGPETNASSSQNLNFSQRILDVLKRYDQFITRNNYAGSLVTSQLLARFGINIGDVKHLYAQRLHFNSETIVIGDVTSTAGTDDNKLGSYAGKAVSASQSNFDFTADDYGIIIVFHWISPVVQYIGSMDASVLRKTFEDFYQPEFDALQNNPISFKEIMDFRDEGGEQYAKRFKEVFGWNERYTNYRKLRSRCTGDMTLFNEFYNWALTRKFHPLGSTSTAGDVYAQSDYAIYQPVIGHPTLNIFNVVSNVADHVFCYHEFDIRAQRLIASSSEATGLPEGQVTIDKNGSHYN